MKQLSTMQKLIFWGFGVEMIFPLGVHAAEVNFNLPAFVQAGDPASFVSALYTYALSIAAALAVIMIVYGGVKYVASGGSAAAKSDAMDIIKNAIFGIVLLFGGYILLYTINPNLVNIRNPQLPTPPAAPSGNGPPSQGDCTITANPSSGPSPLSVSFSSDVDESWEFAWNFGDNSAVDKTATPTHVFQADGVYSVSLTAQLANPTGQGGDTVKSCTLQVSVGSQAGGQCQPPTSGPCSVSALQSSCFGSNAQTAAGVCMIESSGNPLAQSGTDKCDGGEPVSIGLFQINISANQIDGLNCPSAFDHPFSGSHPTCHVLNQSLYQQCVSAAQNAGDNIAKACQMSGNGNNFCQWGPATRTKCGLNYCK